MFKHANIHDILKSHPDLTVVRKKIGVAELIKNEIKKMFDEGTTTEAALNKLDKKLEQ